MARITFNLPDNELLELKKKSDSLGLTISSYVRQVLKDSQQKQPRQPQEVQAVIMAVRRLIPVLVIAMGKTQNQNQQMIDKLTQLLLKEYDQGGL
jgi:hypothetical protein